MSKKQHSPDGETLPLNQLRQGKCVSQLWADWHREHDLRVAEEIGVFRKGETELVVYGYALGKCVVIERKTGRLNPIGFRPWSQPFRVVRRKLASAGWEKASELSVGGHHVH